MGDNIPGESFCTRGEFDGWKFYGWEFSRENFPRTKYIKCILKFVNTYVLLMKFCCKTETLMLQINGNLTVSVEQLIINNKIGLAKKY